MQKALFIGRFQPFHKWHIDAIKQILNENDLLFLAIWSINENWTERNPLDVKNRLNLVLKSLAKEDIFSNEDYLAGNWKIRIFLVPDFNDDIKWKEYVFNNIPKFDCVYSWTNETLNYFRNSHETRLVKINIPISATEIRKEIKENNINWKNWTYLDEETAKIIAKQYSGNM